MSYVKRNIRWILPVVIVAIAAVAFVVAPALGAHAATALPQSTWGY
jgi:uncharacterized membrane protein YdfJ with MMPL/SSD domain